jgi:uncharacterized coiled-coil DUF342 family protein
METISVILNFVVPALTGAVGWFAGGRKRKNDFLNDLQASVNMLASKNEELMEELVKLRSENAEQKNQLKKMQISLDEISEKNSKQMHELITLRGENKDLKKTIDIVRREYKFLDKGFKELLAKMEEKTEI